MKIVKEAMTVAASLQVGNLVFHIMKAFPSVLRFFILNSVHNTVRITKDIQDRLQESEETHLEE